MISSDLGMHNNYILAGVGVELTIYQRITSMSGNPIMYNIIV